MDVAQLDLDLLARAIVKARKRKGLATNLAERRQRLDSDPDYLRRVREVPDVWKVYDRLKGIKKITLADIDRLPMWRGAPVRVGAFNLA